MQTRNFGPQQRPVSQVGFGSWALGAGWGNVEENDAIATLNEVLDRGVNFIDTADVYGDGRSERFIAQVLKSRTLKRAGRTPDGRDQGGPPAQPAHRRGLQSREPDRIHRRSLQYLAVETLDLLQLHCPPTDVYYRPEGVRGAGRPGPAGGKIRQYGVSVEKVEEAIKAMEFPIASVQIIFNMLPPAPGRTVLRHGEGAQGRR